MTSVDNNPDSLINVSDMSGRTAAPEDAEKYKSNRTISSSSKNNEDNCGFGWLRPNLCQRFRHPIALLFCLCWASCVQGMAVNGFINVVITSIERRFNINSKESGLIASCYDIASVLCLVPVSYFGGRGSKPAYLSFGMLVLGLGSLCFLVPHYTTPHYDLSSQSDLLCHRNNDIQPCQSSESSPLASYKYVFYLGQLLHGAGASPLYTIGVAYLDENLTKTLSPLYIGIFYAFSTLGPGMGYLIGGAFLGLYTDFDSEDASKIDPDDSRWIGAWWINFYISFATAIFIVIPTFLLPNKLPGSDNVMLEKEGEVYKGHHVAQARPLGFGHICSSVKQLARNPTFIFLNLAMAADGFVISGFSTFGPKYLEFQYGLSSGYAAQLSGAVVICCACSSTVLGGWLVTRFDMTIRRILKFCLVVTGTATFFGLVFLMRCDNVPFVGVNRNYDNVSVIDLEITGDIQLNNACNSHCRCSNENYDPVCGADVLFYSPCYAGCSNKTADDDGNTKKYGMCSCVSGGNDKDFHVKTGFCHVDCPYLYIFLVVFGALIFCLFLAAIPALSATLSFFARWTCLPCMFELSFNSRCVTYDHRSLALGIQWIMARCLGSIPGPVLFGSLIDRSCLKWKHNCEDEGACIYYDNKQFSQNMLILATVFNVLGCVFYVLSLYLYRPNTSTTNEQNMKSVCTISTLVNTENETFSEATATTDPQQIMCKL